MFTKKRLAMVIFASLLLSACSDDGGSANLCGNAQIDGLEICDGTNLNGKTCADFDASKEWVGGAPSCVADCMALAQGTCEQRAPETCGDSVIQSPEICDRENLNGNTCASIDPSKTWKEGGVPVCAANCMGLEKGTCEEVESVSCGNGTIDTGEICDSTNLNGKTCADFDANTEWEGGAPACSVDCQRLEKGTCMEKKPRTCGDGVIQDPEICDKEALGSNNCATFDPSKRWKIGGMPVCSANCLALEQGTCEQDEPVLCGNGIIDDGELCDGENLNGKTCKDLDLSKVWKNGGAPVCASDCKSLTKGSCEEVTGVCGDGTVQVELGEECEGTGVVNSCKNYNSVYNSGDVTCKDCKLDVSACKTESTVSLVYCQLAKPLEVDMTNERSVYLNVHLHVMGITDKSRALDEDANIKADLVYGTDFKDVEKWKTMAATGDANFDHATDDAYTVQFSKTNMGTNSKLYYTFRVSADAGVNWKYCKLTKDGTRLKNLDFHDITTDPVTLNVNNTGILSQTLNAEKVISQWTFADDSLDATTGSGKATCVGINCVTSFAGDGAGGRAWSINNFSLARDTALTRGRKLQFSGIDTTAATKELKLTFDARISSVNAAKNIIVRYSVDGANFVEVTTDPDIVMNTEELSVFQSKSQALPNATRNVKNLVIELVPYKQATASSSFVIDNVTITE